MILAGWWTGWGGVRAPSGSLPTAGGQRACRGAEPEEAGVRGGQWAKGRIWDKSLSFFLF